MHRMIALSVVFSFLIVHVESFGLPLAFEYAKENPLKSRIYLNPSISIKRIKELSIREVNFIKNNDTFTIDENPGRWDTLVSNEDQPSPRYAQLKNSLCQEKDFRISWVDNSGVEHDSVTQRLGPTPQEWSPEASITMKGMKLENKAIVATIDWTVWQDKLQGLEQLSNIEPIVELLYCETLFDKPVPVPAVSIPRKIIFFHPSYADHKCVFTLRLSVTVYDQQKECRPVFQTTDEKSTNITLRCDQIQGYKCPSSAQTVCKMNCDVKVTAKGDYVFDSNADEPKPIVKLDWQIDSSSQQQSNKFGSVVRFTQLNSNFNNYPVVKAKIETKFVNGTSFNMTAYATSPDAFYGVQICIFSEICKKEPMWSVVQSHAVFVTTIISNLPPPPTTLPTTMATTEEIVADTTEEPLTTKSTKSTKTTTRYVPRMPTTKYIPHLRAVTANPQLKFNDHH